MIVLSLILIFLGCMLDAADLCVEINDTTWEYLYTLTRDLRLLGFILWGLHLCPYKRVNSKVGLFLFAIFQVVVFLINTFFFDKELSVLTVIFLNTVYIIWCLRVKLMREIPSTPSPDSAYYILIPINSIKGLLQAVFLPWHPARYETRMICDGPYVWSVYRGVFRKQAISQTNIKKLKGVKVSLNRRLTDKELLKLNRLDGKRTRLFFSDCRKLLVAGRV